MHLEGRRQASRPPWIYRSIEDIGNAFFHLSTISINANRQTHQSAAGDGAEVVDQ